MTGQRDAARHAAGFTLIEVLITTLIVALILGALLVPLSTQFEARKYSQARNELETIKQALMGFALANGRLPCPDNGADGQSPDGREDTLPGFPAPPISCLGPPGGTPVLQRRGWLPSLTLGVSPTDPWGRYYRYQVANAFMVSAQAGTGCPAAAGPARISFCLGGGLQIQRRGDNPLTAPVNAREYVTVAQQVAAVVFTTGANGRGGVGPDGVGGPVFGATQVTEDEFCNSTDVQVGNTCVLTTVFSSGVRDLDISTPCSDLVAPAGGPPFAPLCPFDDLVTWIPSAQLLERMMHAGWLP